MIRCGRCFLHKSLRVVNVIVNLIGMVMIIYSLWLLKKWVDGFAQLNFSSSVIKPCRFIYTCLGIGIVLCLSTLSGNMVANCISNSTLAVYIIAICSLLLIQVGVIVTIFYKTDWESKITRYIDEHHERFKTFVLFHLLMCRIIAILALVAQINVVVVAVILWSVGGEMRIQCCISAPPNFTYSFLADNSSPVLDDREPRETTLNLYSEGIFKKSFRQWRRIQS
ncbi:hypothetical protein LguiB_027866 [Lonicera macranthoides]